jgi:integrase
MTMATIRKKGDYQWHVQIRRKGFPCQTKTFDIKSDAESWARLIESEMDRGVFIDRSEAESTSLADALTRYSTEVTPRKKGAVREQQRIRRWQADPLAKRMLSTIKGSDIATWRDTQRKAGSSDASIRLELMLLSAVFQTCIREWGMESLSNPVRKITLPSSSKARERRLEADEEKRIFASLDEGCRSNAVAAAVRFALETGARRSEIVSLRWDAVDLKHCTATLLDTKNSENRTVPLSPGAMAVLTGLPRRLDGMVFGIHREAPTRAFTRAVRHARKQYESECTRDGVKPSASFLVNLRLHDLRHEATTRLFESGEFGMMEVASITGHKTLAMLKRYTHLQARDLAKRMRKTA